MNARPITVQPHAVIRTRSPFCRSANAARFYPRIFLCFEGLKGLGRSAPRRRRLSLSKESQPFCTPGFIAAALDREQSVGQFFTIVACNA